MTAETRNVSLQNGNQNVTCLEEVMNWVHKHPETIKTLKIAGLILGIGLLTSTPFAIPWEIKAIVGGAVALIVTLIIPMVASFEDREDLRLPYGRGDEIINITAANLHLLESAARAPRR